MHINHLTFNQLHHLVDTFPTSRCWPRYSLISSGKMDESPENMSKPDIKSRYITDYQQVDSDKCRLYIYIYILYISWIFLHIIYVYILSLIIHLTVTGFDVYYNVPAPVHVRHMSRLIRMHLTLQVYVTIQHTPQFTTHKKPLQIPTSMYYVIKKWYDPNFVIYMTNIEFLQKAAHIPKSRTIMFLHASMKSSHVSLYICNYS